MNGRALILDRSLVWLTRSRLFALRQLGSNTPRGAPVPDAGQTGAGVYLATFASSTMTEYV